MRRPARPSSRRATQQTASPRFSKDTVEVLKQGRVLATLGPGSVLGELSVFVPSASRTATARADSPVRMIKWRADDVRDRLARHERLATAIVADLAFVLAERLDRRTQDVVSLLESPGHACRCQSWSDSAATPWSSWLRVTEESDRPRPARFAEAGGRAPSAPGPCAP